MIKTLLLSLLLSLPINAQESSCEGIKDDCEYYSCIEEQRRCGQKGYLLGFGRKYCMKFSDDEDYFSENGKRWISRVKECLIENLDIPSDNLSCRKFKRVQVKAHVPCYIKSGYCELSRKDRFAVKKVIYKSMWRPSLILAGVRVIASCRL